MVQIAANFTIGYDELFVIDSALPERIQQYSRIAGAMDKISRYSHFRHMASLRRRQNAAAELFAKVNKANTD